MTPLHDADTVQLTEVAATSHPPLALQAPVLPQGGFSVHEDVARGVVADVQVPGVAAQVWHAPLQGPLQQNPSTQFAFAH